MKRMRVDITDIPVDAKRKVLVVLTLSQAVPDFDLDRAWLLVKDATWGDGKPLYVYLENHETAGTLANMLRALGCTTEVNPA